MLLMDFNQELTTLDLEEKRRNVKHPNYNSLSEAFSDKEFQKFINDNLPIMFWDVERCGTMEVGKDRETALIILLDVALGATSDYCPICDEDIDPMEKEIDVRIFGVDVSIKTRKMTNKNPNLLQSFKVTWSSDRMECDTYIRNFEPHYDIMYLPIPWGYENNLYYFTQVAQRDVIKHLGRDQYFKIGAGKDPKGVAISDQAVRLLSNHETTLRLPIKWKNFDPSSKINKIERRCNNIITYNYMNAMEDEFAVWQD